MHVFTLDELIAEARDNVNAERITTALQDLSSALQAQNAGQTTTTGAFNAQTYGAYGNSNTVGTYGQTTYNPALSMSAQQAAQEQIQRDAERLNLKEASSIQELQQTVLKRQSIAPNTWHYGLLVISSPELKKLINPKTIESGQTEQILRFRLNLQLSFEGEERRTMEKSGESKSCGQSDRGPSSPPCPAETGLARRRIRPVVGGGMLRQRASELAGVL